MQGATPPAPRSWTLPALAALVAVAVALVALASIRGLETGARDLVHHSSANLALSGRLRTYVEMQAGASRAFLLTQDAAFLDESRRAGGLILSTLDTLERNRPDRDARALAARLRGAQARYDSVLGGALEGGLRGAPHRERSSFFLRELSPMNAVLDSSASALLAQQRTLHAGAMAASGRDAHRAMVLVLLTCAGGLLLASLLALVLGGRLRRARAQRDRYFAEARAAGDMLRAQGALMGTIAMNTSLALFLQDESGRLTYMNPAAEAMTGYALEEARGRAVHDLFHPRRADGRAYGFEECVTGRAFAAGRRNRGEDFFRRKDGSFVPVAVTSSPIQDRGRVTGMVVEAEDITERKAAEERKERDAEALRAAKENLALAAEAAGVGTWETYPDGRVVLSGSLLELIGYSGEGPAFTLDTALGMVHPDDRARTREAATRAMDPSGNGFFQEEMRVNLPSGAERFFMARGRATFVEGEGGRRLECFRGAAMDITERKAQEEALRQSDERFHILSRATNDAVYDWDIASGRIWWNEGLRTLFGYAGGDPEPRIEWWTRGVHPEDRERVDRSLLAFIADGGETWKAEYRFRCADGAYKNVFDRGFLLRGREGAPIRLIGAMMDVTARMRAEAELRRFRMLVEQSNDFISIGDLEGRCLFLNAGGRRLAGVEESAELGSIADFVLAGDRDKAGRIWQAAAREGQWAGEFNLRNRQTGKAVPVMWNIFPVREPGDGPSAMAAVGRDMTRLQEQEEQLRQGQKMEAIGKLAGGIAHDFNNILTVINGYGELLRGGLAPGDPNRHLLDAMLESGRRAAGLTAQLLAYGRKQVLQPRVLDLNEVVEGTAVMLRRLIGEHIELRLRLDRSLPKVKADPVQIDQILINLCLNARDAMEKGGSLLIETGWTHLAGGLQGRFGDLVPGTYATLTVVDTGLGMPEEVLERIFEPFFTTKETGKGSGLGLSSAYGVIRQSGGGIEVRSRPGEGSTFRVYLPSLSREEEAPPGPEKAAGGAGEAATGRVLLVEDEAHVRTITRNLLEHGGYQVWEARDGVEALALYDRMRPAPDLILTDVLMPRMGGRLLAEEVRKRRPEQRILFMSGYSEEALPESDTSQPGFHFLQKPFTSHTLILAVQEALHAEPVPGGS